MAQFYAWQMQRLDGDDFTGFAATFVADGLFLPAGGGELRGREAIEAASRGAAGRFHGARPRHWFDMMTIEEADDGTVVTSYYAMVTVSPARGPVLVEPTCFVRDTLTRTPEGLSSVSRAITRDDLPARATVAG